MLRTLAPRLKKGDGGLQFQTQRGDIFSKQWVSGEELLKLTKSIKSMAAKSSGGTSANEPWILCNSQGWF